MIKKLLSAVLCFMFILTIFVGCGEKKPIVIKYWTISQHTQEFYETVFAPMVKEKYPHIEFEIMTIAQKDYKQALPLAMKTKDTPDIIELLPEMDPRMFVDNGWIQPIDQWIDPQLVKQFDPRLMVEGLAYFDGKLYCLPHQNRYAYINGMMFVNKTVFSQAGLDPEKDIPKTFSQLREVCQKITAAGKGQFYGMGISGNSPAEAHRYLNGLFTTSAPATADARYGRKGFDYKDGKFKYDNQNHQEVVQLMINIVKDGSVQKGWSSMKKGQVRNLFGDNKIGIYFDGPWMYGIWQKSHPDLDYTIGDTPVPDSGRRAYRYIGVPLGAFYISQFSKHPREAVQVYQLMRTAQFLEKWFKVDGTFPANVKVKLDDLNWFQKRWLEIVENEVRSCPEPKLNPLVARVPWTEVSPNWDEIVTSSLIKGDINYYIKEAQKYNEKMEKALLQNIEMINQNSEKKVTLDDFIFPDWDYRENYIQK